MTSVAALEAHLTRLGRVLLGYSGGVDSAVLAVAGRRALGPERFLAVIGRSDSYPAAQYQSALETARRFDVPLLEAETHELDNPDYRANAPDRCYFCKTELWSRLAEIAERRGFDLIIDGTNADDLGEHRPGVRAAEERRVRSPLAELGWTKAMVRAAARELGLPVWDAPAAPCLSSRIQYGLEVTPERLHQVEAAEAFVRSLGIAGDLRVRHRGGEASVEVAPAMQALVEARWDAISKCLLGLGFVSARLDRRGYQRGGLLADLPVLGA
ncbi:MAG: ATP-dependent sacrificial sulfur transferase LarE [Gemmatimonadota bacterium]